MSNVTKPPKHLTREAKSLWRAILEEYDLEPAEKALLKVALENYCRAQACREEIDKDGPTITDPSGRVRAHPALQAEKNALSHYLQAMRLLALNEEPPRPGPGRPPGGGING